LIDGVTEVLDALDAAGIPYAVGSNGSAQKMQTTLGQHPDVMTRLKGHLYSGQALGCPKPDPGLWLHAARALGVDPADCVVIDDSPTGCTGAARAAMRCLGLAEHDDGASLAATGAEVIHSLRDMLPKIGIGH
jgi:HAD superfamily hydrolase (TIGR01509 family)